MHATLNPSPWLQRWVHLLPAGGTVLDVACGSGRHLRWLAGRGLRMTGIDRDAAALGVFAMLINLPVRETPIVRPAPAAA